MAEQEVEKIKNSSTVLKYLILRTRRQERWVKLIYPYFTVRVVFSFQN